MNIIDQQIVKWEEIRKAARATMNVATTHSQMVRAMNQVTLAERRLDVLRHQD